MYVVFVLTYGIKLKNFNILKGNEMKIFTIILMTINSIVLLISTIFVGFRAVKIKSWGLGWLCFGLFFLTAYFTEEFLKKIKF